jgi:hypothetical protein
MLDSDLVRARHEAAAAGSVGARKITISREFDVLQKRERDLTERVDLGGGETDIFEGAGLEELLHTFAEDEVVAEDSLKLVSALLQRKVNLLVFADLREEQNRLLLSEQSLSDAASRYTELASRWVAMNAQGDPARGCTLSKLEKDEKEVEQGCVRMEEADTAAEDAERALERIRVILHDAVDWVPGDTAKEKDTAILRPERLGSADPLIGAAQLSLSRVRRVLEEIGDLDAGEFQVDLLSGFAEKCIEGLVLDLAEKDGTDRALRPVTWTLTTIRALRGHLSRMRGNARHRLEEVRTRRAQILQRGSR